MLSVVVGTEAERCPGSHALADGIEGFGEAATLGEPRWSEESVERR